MKIIDEILSYIFFLILSLSVIIPLLLIVLILLTESYINEELWDDFLSDWVLINALLFSSLTGVTFWFIIYLQFFIY